MKQKLQVVAGFATLAVLFAAAFLQGGIDYLGKQPLLTQATTFVLLGASLLLVRFFPFRSRKHVWILGLALAVRLLYLPVHPSDDTYRYTWEGRVQNAGHNPYLLGPDAPELEQLRGAHWEGINHKDSAAVYPPGMLLLCRLAAALSPEPVLFKYLFLLVDLGVVALLLALMQTLGRKPEWALVYAMNPMVLLAFAGQGHLDVLLVLFMVLALFCYYRRSWAWMWVALALAFHAKYIGLILLPFLVDRRNLSRAWILPAVAILPYLAFWPCQNILSSLGTFSTDLHFNGSIHAWLGRAIEDWPLASYLCGGLFLVLFAIVWAAVPRPLDGGALAVAALLACAPTVHFWYLTWLIPFLCIRPMRGWLLLTATLSLSFASQAHQHTVGEWKEFPNLLWLQYLPLYLLLLYDGLRPRLPLNVADAEESRPVVSLSVLLPTLNEAGLLLPMLEKLKASVFQPLEVIVCDGGSTDDTVKLAREAGCEVVRGPKGRGRQIAAGLKVARGDAVFIAHADMSLEPDTLERVVQALNATGASGGAVGCRFDLAIPFMKIVAFLNAMRARTFGISFGDQGQFFRRDRLDALGGYPDVMLMEDVELSFRLRAEGRPLYLGRGIPVSARRWEKGGRIGKAILIVWLVGWYAVRRNFPQRDPHLKKYHAKYYA